MPKIFLTGSNDSRGFVTGSGYINNPARVLTRERDNQKTNYPTVKRLGDASRKGDESLGVFDDNFSIAYADKLSDEFNFSNYNEKTIFLKNVNSSLWDVSNTEKVRRDVTLSGTNDFPGEGSFVFEGAGSSGKRWIKTKSKIKNPTVSIDIYQGPYDINLGGLNLNQGSPTDILKIQTSIDGSTWEDVFINSYNVNNEYFLDIAGGYLKPFIDFSNAVLQGNQNNPGLIGISQTTPKSRPMCNVSLSMREFSNHGNQPFYLRIVQDAISDSNKRSWAIGKIDIISRNKPVTYPVLLSQTIDHERRILSQSIASPNQLSNLTVDAASISGISNDLLPKRQDALSPYTDKTRSLQGQTFYDQGVDPKILPGFSSPVLSKTKFEIDLSPSSPTEFGHITHLDVDADNTAKPANYDRSENGQQYMVYWNNILKKWEKRGRPLTINNISSGTPTGTTYLQFMSQSCLGFAGIDYFVKTEGGSQQEENAILLSKDYYSVANKPTTAFGFPFSGQYYATSSQYILAKDIGITKPFLLEKCVIDVDVNMRVNAESLTAYTPFLWHGGNLTPPGSGTVFSATKLGIVYTPTFFILRQFKGSFTQEIKTKYSVTNTTPSTGELKYSVEIPGNYHLNSGSNEYTYVDESRELITYGQFTYYATNNSSSVQFGTNIKALYPEDFIEQGLRSDLNIIKDRSEGIYDASKRSYILSESLSIPFESKVCSKYPDIFPISIYDGTIVDPGDSAQSSIRSVIIGKESLSRGNIGIENGSRGIINNIAAQNPGETAYALDKTVPYTGVPAIESQLPKRETLERKSPYLIMPDDKLIFGWQFPPAPQPIAKNATSGNHHKHSMELINQSKLTLYGSQIQNGVEFHEGLNQQLSTNSVYEIIGSEPVVDQFQISTRQELTGSLFASLTFANVWQDPVLSFGTGIFNKKYFNYTEPFRRINLRVYDTISGELYNSIKPLSPQFIELFWKNQFNTNLFDMSRDYIDSLYSSGKYLKNSLYGTIDSLSVAGSNESGYQLTKSGNLTKITLNPMYVFNNSHFGYYSDMIIQGKDSRFIDDPTTSQDDIVTQSPIKIQFVKSEYDDTGLDVRTFFAIRPSDINNTAEITYQSSNLSLYATSSLPFFDDGIVKNRSYIENEVIIS